MEFGDIVKTIGSLPVEIGKLIAKDPVGFITDELLGFDDFSRAARYAGQGDFLKMLKSLGAGTFEAGSTLIPGGQILKAGKVMPLGARVSGMLGREVAPRTVTRALPMTRSIFGREVPTISGRIISSIPGATEVVGSNLATRAPVLGLSQAGRRGLQAFRAGEAAQWLDLANALSAGVGAPAIPFLPGARMASEERNRILNNQRVLQILAGLGGDPYAVQI